MQLPNLEELLSKRPIVFVIDRLLRIEDNINLATADKLNAISGMSNEDIETLVLDMLCCHLNIGDPDRDEFDVDSQYLDWMIDCEKPLDDDDIADAAGYLADIHMRIYRPLLQRSWVKIHRLNTSDYSYSWTHVDDGKVTLLVFKVDGE